MTATQLLPRPLTHRNLSWPDYSSSPQQKIDASHRWKEPHLGFDGTFIPLAVKPKPRGTFHREQARSRERTTSAAYYEDRGREALAVKHDPPKTVGGLVPGSTDLFRPWHQLYKLYLSLAPETNPVAGFEAATLATWLRYIHTARTIHRSLQSLQDLQQMQEEKQGKQRLWNRLDTSFAHEDLDPDRDHPAERTLGQALFSPRGRRWLIEFCTDEGHPELAASLLLCLCRLPTLYLVEWEEQLITRARACDDVEIRDAAVQLAAAWGGDHLQGLLQSHQDSEGWLQDYIGSVLTDWSI